MNILVPHANIDGFWSPLSIGRSTFSDGTRFVLSLDIWSLKINDKHTVFEPKPFSGSGGRVILYHVTKCRVILVNFFALKCFLLSFSTTLPVVLLMDKALCYILLVDLSVWFLYIGAGSKLKWCWCCSLYSCCGQVAHFYVRNWRQIGVRRLVSFLYCTKMSVQDTARSPVQCPLISRGRIGGQHPTQRVCDHGQLFHFLMKLLLNPCFLKL